MGQYHAFACVDTGEALFAHPMGQGLKLLEQGSGGYGGPTTGFALLVAPNGAWHGKRVVVVGDYAEVGDLQSGLPFADNPRALFDAIEPEPGVAPFTDGVKSLIGEAFGIRYEGKGWQRTLFDERHIAALVADTADDPHFGPLFVVNRDRGEYLDPQRFGSGRNLPAIALRNGGVLLATAVLLAVSNGRGGGDFRPFLDEDADLAGLWGGQVVLLGRPEPDMVDVSERVAAAFERDGLRDEEWAPWTLGALPSFLR